MVRFLRGGLFFFDTDRIVTRSNLLDTVLNTAVSATVSEVDTATAAWWSHHRYRSDFELAWHRFFIIMCFTLLKILLFLFLSISVLLVLIDGVVSVVLILIVLNSVVVNLLLIILFLLIILTLLIVVMIFPLLVFTFLLIILAFLHMFLRTFLLIHFTFYLFFTKVLGIPLHFFFSKLLIINLNAVLIAHFFGVFVLRRYFFIVHTILNIILLSFLLVIEFFLESLLILLLQRLMLEWLMFFDWFNHLPVFLFFLNCTALQRTILLNYLRWLISRLLLLPHLHMRLIKPVILIWKDVAQFRYFIYKISWVLSFLGQVFMMVHWDVDLASNLLLQGGISLWPIHLLLHLLYILITVFVDLLHRQVVNLWQALAILLRLTLHTVRERSSLLFILFFCFSSILWLTLCRQVFFLWRITPRKHDLRNIDLLNHVITLVFSFALARSFRDLFRDYLWM